MSSPRMAEESERLESWEVGGISGIGDTEVTPNEGDVASEDEEHVAPKVRGEVTEAEALAEEIAEMHNRLASKVDPTSSKYDYVKVRVWIRDHYYILSRFLISRYLTVTKVLHDDAIKIALELKKVLVDAGKLEVQHSELEEKLFEVMRAHGYSTNYITKFKLMTKFHHLRIPLVILIVGTGCVGKSTLATQLAERLNLPSVLQTDLVYEVMRSLGSDHYALDAVPVWYRRFESDTDFFDEFQRECSVIRQGVEGEIQKCLDEGKSIIIEGSHLDLSLYHQLLQPSKGDKPYIVVPFLITADDSERLIFLENYLRSSSIDNTSLGHTPEEQRRILVHNFRICEEYLVSSNKYEQTQLVKMSARAFPDALEALQDVVLSRIQTAVQPFLDADESVSTGGNANAPDESSDILRKDDERECSASEDAGLLKKDDDRSVLSGDKTPDPKQTKSKRHHNRRRISREDSAAPQRSSNRIDASAGQPAEISSLATASTATSSLGDGKGAAAAIAPAGVDGSAQACSKSTSSRG